MGGNWKQRDKERDREGKDREKGSNVNVFSDNISLETLHSFQYTHYLNFEMDPNRVAKMSLGHGLCKTLII